MTHEFALAFLKNFNYHPAKAFAGGVDTYGTFQECWDVIFPGTYWQCQRRSKADGGVQFHYVDTTDNSESPALSPGYGQ